MSRAPPVVSQVELARRFRVRLYATGIGVFGVATVGLISAFWGPAWFHDALTEGIAAAAVALIAALALYLVTLTRPERETID
jgi:hypothetical protein